MSKEMETRSVASHMNFLWAIVATSIAIAALIPVVRSSGKEQSKSEREFEDKIPKHLPIKVRIHPDHEKAAKDLNNGRWQHDLAFEVKNTGDKPIYYVSFFMDMPEIKPDGSILGAHLYYGMRSIFGEWKGIAQPDDVPIKPNETVVLILGRQADGWDKRSKIQNLPQPSRLELVFQELNFGDGTGFVGGTGTPWQRQLRKSDSDRRSGQRIHAN